MEAYSAKAEGKKLWVTQKTGLPEQLSAGSESPISLSVLWLKPKAVKLISTTEALSAPNRALPKFRSWPLAPDRERRARGWNDQGRRPQVKIREMIGG